MLILIYSTKWSYEFTCSDSSLIPCLKEYTFQNCSICAISVATNITQTNCKKYSFYQNNFPIVCKADTVLHCNSYTMQNSAPMWTTTIYTTTSTCTAYIQYIWVNTNLTSTKDMWCVFSASTMCLYLTDVPILHDLSNMYSVFVLYVCIYSGHKLP